MTPRRPWTADRGTKQGEHTMLHKAMQNEWSRIAIAVFATFLYAMGVNLFIVPVGLYSGGMVGLSQVIRTVLAQRVALPAGVDIAGILYFLLNVPMLLIGTFKRK